MLVSNKDLNGKTSNNIDLDEEIIVEDVLLEIDEKELVNDFEEKTKDINFEEIVVENDLILSESLSNNDSTLNSTIPDEENIKEDVFITTEEILIDVDILVDDSTKRKLQKTELLKDDEVYEIEIDSCEPSVPLTKEKFEHLEEGLQNIEVIDLPKPKQFIKNEKEVTLSSKVIEEKNIDNPNQKNIQEVKIDDSSKLNTREKTNTVNEEMNALSSYNDLKKTLQQQENHDLNNVKTNRNVVQYDSDILTDKNKKKEYITKNEVIYNGDKGLAIYQKKNVKPIVKKKNNDILLIPIILVSFVIIVASYFVLDTIKNSKTFNYNLSEEIRQELTEQYYYTTTVNEYLKQLDELSKRERFLINQYTEKEISRDEILKEMKTILKAKQEMYILHDEHMPSYESVVKTKNLSNNIIETSIQMSNEIVNIIEENGKKILVVETFNQNVEKYNSLVYMYNQYMQTVYREHNIPVYIDNNQIIIESNWMQEPVKIDK